MLRSMTAFARQERQTDWGVLSWEIRSVNHRYLDMTLRQPEEFRALDGGVRKRVSAAVGRGKLDCGLRFQAPAASAERFSVNMALVERLAELSDVVSHQLGGTALVSPLDVLRWPGVLETESPDLAPLHTAALELLEATLGDLVTVREAEGGRMQQVITARCASLTEQVELAQARRPQVVAGLRTRLEARLAEIGVDADPGRLEQEMVIQAQRLDVDEELERLRSHLTEMQTILKQDKPVGRRLDFLMQEFNREANTLGSKSADVETTRVSVEMKVLIEQMREQIQNIE